MGDQPHVETTPETTTPEQAADLAALESIAADIGGGDEVSEVGQEQDGPTIPTRELIAPLVSMLCATVAPAWGITEAEQDQLAGSYAAVVDKYFPDGVPMGPEVGALVVTAAIVMPRLGQPLKIEEKGADDANE